MKSTSIIFFLIFSLISFKGICQKDAYSVKLQPKEKLSVSSFYISEVIDSRVSKNGIGVTQKGAFNKQVVANFSENFEIHLQNTFNILLPPSENKEEFTAIIHKLYISERTSTMTELGTCEVEIEFLKSEDGIQYSLGNYAAKVEGKGLDVSSKHDERILEAITQVINEVAAVAVQKKLEDLPIANTERSIRKLDFSEGLKEGLYYSFNDLVSNSPKDTIAYNAKLIAETKKFEHYMVYYQNAKKRIKNLYGYSDGESIYLNVFKFTQAEYFIKSKFLGRYVYFEDQYDNKNVSAAFGMIGALASTKLRGIVLDTQTGIITELTDNMIEDLLEQQPQLLQEYKGGARKIEDIRAIIKKLNDTFIEQKL
ncbi:hypothetical protein BC962_0084 [Gillisia mitskevichiae]|uniref:Uncharacterized protein n=1 Tax=Gillisia mitskevichiae TaxID=270921 RepID=A0A495PWY3_9FLAO|nr:hypothetical protein [Gillisia mitskevichiae]RKS55127.1 hypothetical protein BC962_0084 [Gillisia mitskevichiae]